VTGPLGSFVQGAPRRSWRDEGGGGEGGYGTSSYGGGGGYGGGGYGSGGGYGGGGGRGGGGDVFGREDDNDFEEVEDWLKDTTDAEVDAGGSGGGYSDSSASDDEPLGTDVDSPSAEGEEKDGSSKY